MSAGRPVIAFAKGGALETVVDNVTGILFPEQTAESLIGAIHKFEQTSISADACREQARKFDESVFKRTFLEYVESHVGTKPTAREL
jgi:glycosyltransferase involved in cell wall biosynthesis